MRKDNIEHAEGCCEPIWDKDYKAMYESASRDYENLASMYEKMVAELKECRKESVELHKKLETYEAIIRTVEAFVGQPIMNNPN